MANYKRDAHNIARYMYENNHVGGNSIVVSELRAAFPLSSGSFDVADDYLLRKKYCEGTTGGDDGRRWLTPTGVTFAKTKLPQKKEKSNFWGIFIVSVFIVIIMGVIVAFLREEIRKLIGLE
jgi:hypothetical protein